MDISTREQGVFLFGPFRLDPVRRTLLRDGVLVTLAPRLFDTLLHLIANHERLVEKGELIAAVWGRRTVEEANLSQAIFALRKALQTGPTDDTIIVTAPGRGYRCGVPVVFEASAGQEVRAGSFVGPRSSAESGFLVVNVWRRHLLSAALAGLVLLLLASGATIWRLLFAAKNNQQMTGASFVPPPHSVAVMAFTNLSGDPAQEYFSDGLSEELIDALGRVGTMRVPARLSSFSFKGKQIPISEIARKLNVRTVLEGSVRREGARLRITTQLIDADTDYQLWSHSYDRDQGDVLKVQREIAEAVATSLNVSLLGDDVVKLSLGGTSNAKALDAYLQGVNLMRHDDKDATRRALAAFDEALALDPDFALAQAGRAQALISVVQSYAGDDVGFVQSTRANALAAAERAVSLAPELGKAHVALGDALQEVWSFVRADVEYTRARELAPDDPVVDRQYAYFQGSLGHNAIAVAAAQRAVVFDPLTPGPYMTLASTLAWARRPDDALVALRHAEQLGFGGPRYIDQKAQAELLKGDFGAVRRTCAGEQDPFQNVFLAIADHALGMQADAEIQLAKVRAELGNNGAYIYADIYAQWGRENDSVRWLETAYALHDDGLVDLRSDQLIDPIRNTPRFKEIERLMNLPP